MSDELVLEIDPPYIGSAVSPTVDITETTTDVTVTITDFQGDHSYTIEKTDQAIADAEQAATNANTAAANATSTANQAAQYARNTADQAAADAQATANAAAGRADTAAGGATQAAQAANTAAGTANTAASNANDKAALADSKATLANTAATTANAAAQAAEAAKTAANTAAGQATTAAGQATTAAGTANTAATNADTKAQLADTAAANADTATQAANTATTNATNAAQTATTAAATATQAAESITDGYFPHMISGAAEALMDVPSVQEAFAERVSTHDGVARIESVHGNTVVFNQLANISTRADIVNNGVTYAFPGNGAVRITGTNNGEAASSASLLTAANVIGAIAGHKYLLRGCPSGGSTNTYYLIVTSTNVWGTAASRHDIGSGNIIAAQASGDINISFSAKNGTTVDFTIYPQMFDLTQTFGSGNEPATVEEFERMFPASYYAYDAGSLLSVNIEGVNDREIPAATYFPDGMKSAGSVYDELTATKAIKRVGVVDLGTLNWDYSGSVKRFYVVGGISDAKPSTKWNECQSIISNNYTQACIANSDDGATDVYGIYNRYIYVKDNAYTDAAAFKAAMSGVMLYYELATPVETEITPPLTLTYTVEQGGTESIIIPTGENSAPVPMAIAYAQSPDGVRDRALAVIAPIEGVTASGNYAVNSYLIHDGGLYRVTSAIATGETITPGSNCVACTVMGEIVRLTA